jgi:hypothetical protein
VAEAGDVGEDVVSKAKREMRNQHIRYADPTR